jgi:hypothetical protein
MHSNSMLSKFQNKELDYRIRIGLYLIPAKAIFLRGTLLCAFAGAPLCTTVRHRFWMQYFQFACLRYMGGKFNGLQSGFDSRHNI